MLLNDLFVRNEMNTLRRNSRGQLIHRSRSKDFFESVTHVVLEPHEERDEERAHYCERSKRDKEKGEDHGEYVDNRLREWAAWEQRISGKG